MSGQSGMKWVVPKDRVFERNRGCYSCKHYECGELSRQKYAGTRDNTIARAVANGTMSTAGTTDLDLSKPELQLALGALRKEGLSEVEAVDAIIAQRSTHSAEDAVRLWDRMIYSGAAGICMIGGQPGDEPSDFVHSKCLCDKWSGVQGSSEATAGKPLDKLSDELRDIADGRAKKV